MEVSSVDTLQKTSNCYRLPGRAGGPPYGLALPAEVQRRRLELDAVVYRRGTAGCVMKAEPGCAGFRLEFVAHRSACFTTGVRPRQYASV